MNNKIKPIGHRSFGFRGTKNYIAAIHHCRAKRPLPNWRRLHFPERSHEDVLVTAVFKQIRQIRPGRESFRYGVLLAPVEGNNHKRPLWVLVKVLQRQLGDNLSLS